MYNRYKPAIETAYLCRFLLARITYLCILPCMLPVSTMSACLPACLPVYIYHIRFTSIISSQEHYNDIITETLSADIMKLLWQCIVYIYMTCIVYSRSCKNYQRISRYAQHFYISVIRANIIMQSSVKMCSDMYVSFQFFSPHHFESCMQLMESIFLAYMSAPMIDKTIPR